VVLCSRAKSLPYGRGSDRTQARVSNKTPGNQGGGWSVKLWIDQAENFTLKTVDTVIGDHIYPKPGSTITFEFEKISDDAWLPVRQLDDFHLQFAKFIRPSGRSDYQYSKFRKFDVQSTINMEPSK
jgi:hypothetical protein